MNSLSLGFLYVCGLSWLLCEVCVSASNGNWTPLWMFLIFFTLMFTILGCWPLSGKAIDAVGPIFAALMGVGIILYGFGGFGASVVGGVIRVLGGAVLILFGFLGYSLRNTEESH
ncbi:MAG: hypothetical protein L7V87_12325 [Verrucomicrobiales bacterium]|jgi:hypothetical protein|nr:hypothetical protein [Verrucomicrobiales bacterium]